MERGQNININRSLEEVASNPHGWLWGVEDLTADVVETAELVLEVESGGDFPGGPVVKNPSCNAEDTSSIPGQGTKIPHDSGQLSLCAITTEHTSHN